MYLISMFLVKWLIWNIDGLLKSKYLSFITLIPQVDIVKTQSLFGKPGSVWHIAASGTGASDWLYFHEIDGILWWMLLAAHFFYISLLKIKELWKCNEKNFLFHFLLRNILKFIFHQSESYVLTMLSWSRRLKIYGLKSSIEVQLPTVKLKW